MKYANLNADSLCYCCTFDAPHFQAEQSLEVEDNVKCVGKTYFNGEWIGEDDDLDMNQVALDAYLEAQYCLAIVELFMDEVL